MVLGRQEDGEYECCVGDVKCLWERAGWCCYDLFARNVYVVVI